MSPTRNSRIRELTAEPIGRVAGWLHEQFSWLSPDQVTVLGLLGTALGAIWATEQNSENRGNRLLPLIVLVASSGMDALDGALARAAGQVSEHGQILDACSDRIGEAAMGLARMVAVLRKRDIVGTVAATMATLTAPLPSWARALAEERERVVPETGKNAFDLIGTRLGRTAFGIGATVFPEIKGFPLQWVLDGLTAAANLATAIDRFRIARVRSAEPDANDPILPPETREEARQRRKALTVVTAVIFASAAFTLWHGVRRRSH